MRRRALKLAMAALAGAVVMVVVLVGSATPKQRGADPARVISKSDPAKAKLDDELQAKVEAGATASVPVFVTAKGDVSQVKALLDDDKTAQIAGKAIVVGRIPAQTLPKLASVRSVVSVGLVSFKQTGEPLGVPDPLLNRRPSKATLKSRRDAQKRDEVPYSEAPEPRSGHFEELKKLGVMDARTHDFAGAWRAGFAGEGTTVGVLDGGTDFAHPDLLGTWQTWSGASDTATIDDGWNGWPKAFDPFDTLVWLLDPGRVDVGLSWYTPTHGADCTGSGKTCHVDFATRTGPSRNFDAPSGTKTHSYSFPRAWSKSGTVKLGSHPDDYLLQQYLERPAFLVVDAHVAAVYDTVYVDLDDDYSFADEKPVTQGSPASYRDMNGDGLTDLSGGLLYYISDGETRIPGGLTSFLGPDTPAPGAGDLLAWTGDYDTGIEGHGTLTASNIVGQAVINGKAPSFDDLPTKDGRVPGEVIGGSPHAKLAPYGDIYFSFDFATQFGYLLSAIRGIDVTSNSYGNSDVDNDGYDAGSQEADIIHDGSRTTPLFSTGNGAPGYGTTTPPAPSAGIKVGASTQFGATGWDSIAKIGQVVDDDVMVWSNRGPGATGANGVDVVADGAFSSGDITLNSVRNGDVAWETWGGTSRSAPVAASATALVYQAYRQAHPGAVPSGFYATAKTILKSSADDLGYDSFTQGSGSIDAARAVKAAGSGGTTVSPGEWRVGDYRGNEYPVFTHVIAPGASDTQTFTISGPGTWSVSDRYLKRSATETFKVNTSSQAKESAFNFNAPDYLVDISDRVKRHPNADLMVVRALYPHDQFDGDASYETDQDWRLLTYNWTDVNRDHDLWIDRDHDGAVDHTDKAEGEDIDHNALLDFKRSEMEKGEYVRFMYHRPGANSLMSFVRDPRKRMDDGIFLGLQHTTHNPKIDRTNFTIQIDWYENGDWPWLTAPANATGSFAAKLSVPPGTPYGMYDGAIVLSKDKVSTVVPVDVAVAATATQGADGSLTDALRFGGADVAAAQRNLTYDNGSVFGATDWAWRPESGDWRFFFFDVPKAPPAGTLFLADTTWDDAAPFTDLDTLIFGRSENQYQLFDPAPFGGPYILGTVGKSQNTNTGAGVWTFDTATGGAREVVAAPAQEGLQALAQHQVGWQGDKFDASFSTTLGSASVTPSSVEQSTAADSGSFDVTFKANVDLDGLKAEAFGLSQPQTTAEPVAQDDPDDPSTASNKKNLTINHASRLHVDTAFPTEDVDLYVVYDANGDGAFTPDEIVASSAGGTANEAVDLIRPADGNYQIWLHGFQVAGTPSIQLTLNAVQGNDLTVTGVPSGAVPAGTAVTLHVAFSKAMTAGQDYFGELLLGPSSAPSALTVPIKISRTA